MRPPEWALTLELMVMTAVCVWQVRRCILAVRAADREFWQAERRRLERGGK